MITLSSDSQKKLLTGSCGALVRAYVVFQTPRTEKSGSGFQNPKRCACVIQQPEMQRMDGQFDQLRNCLASDCTRLCLSCFLSHGEGLKRGRSIDTAALPTAQGCQQKKVQPNSSETPCQCQGCENWSWYFLKHFVSLLCQCCISTVLL